MPELPDLEAIKVYMESKLTGLKIERVEIKQPVVIRQPAPQEFSQTLTGNTFSQISRHGKFLLFHLKSGHILAIHLMLVGKLQYCEPKEKLKPRTCLTLHLSGDKQLRYFDSKLMGKVYLVPKRKLSLIPRWNEMGPDALNDSLTLEIFAQRIRKFSGQIKNVLTNDSFLTGIGNAYADEILFDACIYPFWPCTSLSQQETESLYDSMRAVLQEATETISDRMEDDISIEMRDFLKVHLKGGKSCPACGSEISQIEVNRRITNFCRTCQGERSGDMFSSGR